MRPILTTASILLLAPLYLEMEGLNTSSNSRFRAMNLSQVSLSWHPSGSRITWGKKGLQVAGGEAALGVVEVKWRRTLQRVACVKPDIAAHHSSQEWGSWLCWRRVQRDLQIEFAGAGFKHLLVYGVRRAVLLGLKGPQGVRVSIRRGTELDILPWQNN